MAITLDGTNGINSSGVIVAPDGSASAPSITNDGDTNTGIFFPAADVTAITTGGTERARITSGGQFLVGTTASFDNDYTMQLNVSTANGFITKPPTNKTYNALGFRNSSNSEVGYISCSNTATVFGTSSDYRLKENVAPMTGALAKVLELKPVTYTWNADGSAGQGFIAHELQAIVPDCVVGEKDAVNEDGSIKPQGVDTSFLVATLTAAIQELKAINDAQASRIETLEAKVAALEEQS